MAGINFSAQDLLLMCVIWGAWLYCISVADQGCRRMKFTQPVDGKRLEGHVFLTLSIGIYTSCEHRCVMESKCVSVNIGPWGNDKVVCELSDSHHLQHPEDLIQRIGWTYRGKEVNCNSSPCFHNGTCLNGHSDKRYHCLCPPGFTGENCEKDCSSNEHHFERYQDLATKAAADVEQFSINGSLFLAFANFYGDKEKWNTDSFIYKLNDSTGKFFFFQSIPTNGTRNVEHFTIADKHFLAFACHHNGLTYQLNSVVYQWDGLQFVLFQNISTNGAGSFNFFEIMTDPFLAVANFHNDSTHFINSIIYKWSDGQFKKFQEVPTEGALASTAFVINNYTFVAFANYHNPRKEYSVHSTLFKWSGERFVKVQSLQTYGAREVTSFNNNGNTFLAFANHRNGSNNYSIDSFIYKWNGSAFVLFQPVPTHGANMWHPFVMCGQTYLGVANYYDERREKYDIQSVVYKVSEGKLIQFRDVLTRGAHGMTSFEYKGHNYLAVANYFSDISKKYDINSTLYKWI